MRFQHHLLRSLCSLTLLGAARPSVAADDCQWLCHKDTWFPVIVGFESVEGAKKKAVIAVPLAEHNTLKNATAWALQIHKDEGHAQAPLAQIVSCCGLGHDRVFCCVVGSCANCEPVPQTHPP